MAKKEEIKVKVNTEEPKEKGKKAEEMPKVPVKPRPVAKPPTPTEAETSVKFYRPSRDGRRFLGGHFALQHARGYDAVVPCFHGGAGEASLGGHGAFPAEKSHAGGGGVRLVLRVPFRRHAHRPGQERGLSDAPLLLAAAGRGAMRHAVRLELRRQAPPGLARRARDKDEAAHATPPPSTNASTAADPICALRPWIGFQ